MPERFDLVPPSGVRRVAKAMATGAERYGENNYLNGMPVAVCVNHAIRHLYLWLEGDRSEDHFGHAAANVLMAMEVQRGVRTRDH